MSTLIDIFFNKYNLKDLKENSINFLINYVTQSLIRK